MYVNPRPLIDLDLCVYVCISACVRVCVCVPVHVVTTSVLYTQRQDVWRVS